jgi:hypothetical protein
MVYCFHVFYWKMLYVDSSREWGDEQKDTKIDRSTPISKYLTFDIFDTNFDYLYYKKQFLFKFNMQFIT